MITVYTQPGCRPCKRVLSKILDSGLEHQAVDITTDPAGMAYVRSIGAKSVPVVRADEAGYAPIVGYQPDLLSYMLETFPR